MASAQGPEHRWKLATARPDAIASLVRGLSVGPLLARCLVARGFSDCPAAARFLEPRLRDLGDPCDLPDLDRAVQRLLAAREAGEAVVVFGDYDVDGVTATALLEEVLGSLGWAVTHYLPQRFTEGYGLSREAVENCLRQQPARVLIAVDCGSTSVEVVAWLQGQGVDVLVFDHHQVSDPAPAAAALVNPRRLNGGEHGARDLCSVGLVFKLAHALVKEGRRRGGALENAYDVRRLLDLVALGTVADVVPLTGENRTFVKVGLERLATTARPGLRALLDLTQSVKPGVEAVGFQLGPRLNAAGRLEHASAALELLRSGDAVGAARLARELDHQNRERQRLESSILQEALVAVRARLSQCSDPVILEGQADWHLGVVGIVAGRISREFYRPTLILGGDGEYWRGSGRSIEGFDLAGALRDCGPLLVRHGGHAMAAGVTVRPADLDALRARLGELARARLTPEQFQPELRLDGELALGEITLAAVEELSRLEPCGSGNPAVQFAFRQVRLGGEPRRMGAEGRHVKWTVEDPTGRAEVVWWGGGGQATPGGPFDLAAQPRINEFNGRRTVQLRLLDWRNGGTA